MNPLATQLLTDTVEAFFQRTAGCWHDARTTLDKAQLSAGSGQLFDAAAEFERRIDGMAIAGRKWVSQQAAVFRALPEPVRQRLSGSSPKPASGASDFAIVAALLARPELERRYYREQVRRDRETYSALGAEDAQAVADAAIGVVETGAEDTDDLAEDLLSKLAAYVPGSLAGRQARLARLPGLWRNWRSLAFRGADAEARDILLSQLAPGAVDDLLADKKARNALDRLMLHLSWIGDAEVCRRFAEWRATPPEWRSHLNILPDGYAPEAGWELTDEGTRRDLCLSEGWLLLPPEELSAEPGREPQMSTGRAAPTGLEPALPGSARPPAPVAVGRPRTDACGRCRNPLTDILDVDLTDPRMAFLAGAGLRGRRLRIPTCSMCWCLNYSTFDTDGNSAWAPYGDDYMAAEPGTAFHAFKAEALVLGPALRTPVQAFVSRDSHIGGHPSWCQDAGYPSCPRCDKSMTLIARLDMDLLDGNGDAYIHTCASCGIAGTAFQCT